MRTVLLAILALVACKREDVKQPPPPDPSDIVVQAPGVAPLRPLRYALAKGTKTTIDLAMDTELHADDMGGAMPTMVATFELDVEDVLPDGRMKLRSTIVDAVARDRDGAKATAISEQNTLAQLKGLAITATLTPEGKLSDAHVDTGDKKLPDALTAQLGSLTRSLEQLAMPLPHEPVGATAKWTSVRQLDLDGMNVTSTSTIDLVSITDGQLAYRMKTVMVGPDQQVTRGGLAMDVTNLHGTGTGEGKVDLAKLATTGTFENELQTDMTAAGEKSHIDMTMKLELTPR
jgi:hypothetical protein